MNVCACVYVCVCMCVCVCVFVRVIIRGVPIASPEKGAMKRKLTVVERRRHWKVRGEGFGPGTSFHDL